MNYQILVVEDEKAINDAVEIYLKNQGYTVFKAENGVEALKIMEKETIHLAIVDIMMPIMDGITMTMKAREQYDFPIIMLSAKSEDLDKITGLNIGADDYVTKPFTPMELLARVNAQLRSYTRYLKLQAEKQENERVIRLGGLELQIDRKQLYVNGEQVKVTPLEFKILHLLMSHPGRVFSSDEIYESVWKENAINSETVMVHIRNIREKIEIDPKNPRHLKVVWGVGYKMEN